MRCLLKLGGSFMADLGAARAVLDRAFEVAEITGVIVGTGHPFEWYAEQLSAVDLKVKGYDRMHLSAACQSANELALTILDRRLRLTGSTTALGERPTGYMQLLHVADFLNGTLDGPIGSDCKALKIAEYLGWEAVVLAKRRDDLPRSGVLTTSVLRTMYPKLIDRGFEEMWSPAIRVFILPALECIRDDQRLLDACLELVR